MKATLIFCFLVALLMTNGPNRQVTAEAPVINVAALTGPAVLDDWGNRFASLGALVPENPLRTLVRTTIAQMAMFDAVNAVLDGPYRPFASTPPSAPGASAEAAAIRAAYTVALNEFPTQTVMINSAYNWQPRDPTGSGVGAFHCHSVAPRISRGAPHGRRERAGVLYSVVRHR